MPSVRVVVLNGSGGPEVLSIDERDVRDPGPGEVLVEVAACGLNRADILQRRGLYPAPPGAIADVPGLEYAGTIAAVGANVHATAVGARVMGIVGGGGMATHLVVHEREIIPVPASMTLTDAAAVPEVFLTAYDALFVQAGIGLGSRVLIHAVGSGVGTAAVQLVQATGAGAIGTSRTASKLERCAEFGLHPDSAIHVEDGTFSRQVLEKTDGRGVDVILDLVGGAYLEENIRAVATRGRVIVVGLVGGLSGKTPLGLLLRKRASVVGTVLRSRPLEEKARLAQQFADAVLPRFVDGTIRPVVGDVLPMDKIARAHERMESNQTFGKLILRW